MMDHRKQIDTYLNRCFGKTISCIKCDKVSRCGMHRHMHNKIYCKSSYICRSYLKTGSCDDIHEKCNNVHEKCDKKLLCDLDERICIHTAYNNVKNNPFATGCHANCKYAHNVNQYLIKIQSDKHEIEDGEIIECEKDKIGIKRKIHSEPLSWDDLLDKSNKSNKRLTQIKSTEATELQALLAQNQLIIQQNQLIIEQNKYMMIQLLNLY